MSQTRLLVLAAVALFIGIAIGNAFVMRDGGPNDRAVQERCEKDVLGRLASPQTAKLTDVKVTDSTLDPETTDLAPLTREAFKGVDHGRISVRSVSGIVQAPNAFGDAINDPFTCRVYFVDGALTDTLVVFDHDH